MNDSAPNPRRWNPNRPRPARPAPAAAPIKQPAAEKPAAQKPAAQKPAVKSPVDAPATSKATEPKSKGSNADNRPAQGRGPKGRPKRKPGPNTQVASTPGEDARRVAIDVLVRIDTEGAYANLVLPKVLARSKLDERDRGFVTELVYGTMRMRRACDHLVDRFVIDQTVEPEVRAALRVGAYQLAFAGTPPHAALNATVAAVPKRARGFVNAILRRVSQYPIAHDEWPNEATRLSYPDWIVDRLFDDLGHIDALGALEAMNEAATVHVRDDGYRQDRASVLVAQAVEAREGLLVADVCAAPGGKATALASTGARVIASDVRPRRLSLVTENRETLGLDNLAVIAADGRHLPYADRTFDRVLVDAPCSGLGALRRRPDARWRITADAIDRLVEIQRDIVDEAIRVLAPGGLLVYSVCTLTVAESTGIDAYIGTAYPELVPEPVEGGPWRTHGRGVQILPQDDDTDGMNLFRYRKG